MKKRLFKNLPWFVEISTESQILIHPLFKEEHVCTIKTCRVLKDGSILCHDFVSFPFDSVEELNKFYEMQVKCFGSAGYRD